MVILNEESPEKIPSKLDTDKNLITNETKIKNIQKPSINDQKIFSAPKFSSLKKSSEDLWLKTQNQQETYCQKFSKLIFISSLCICIVIAEITGGVISRSQPLLVIKYYSVNKKKTNLWSIEILLIFLFLKSQRFLRFWRYR